MHSPEVPVDEVVAVCGSADNCRTGLATELINAIGIIVSIGQKSALQESPGEATTSIIDRVVLSPCVF